MRPRHETDCTDISENNDVITILDSTEVSGHRVSADFTEEELVELCSKHVGTEKALSVKLMVDENGKSKCFGFASFANHDDADLLVKALN